MKNVRRAIVGDEVVVTSAKIPKPAAVRYAWSAVASDANLFNGAGFPAGPFRTDKW